MPHWIHAAGFAWTIVRRTVSESVRLSVGRRSQNDRALKPSQDGQMKLKKKFSLIDVGKLVDRLDGEHGVAAGVRAFGEVRETERFAHRLV